MEVTLSASISNLTRFRVY